jgi:hypothetical protein
VTTAIVPSAKPSRSASNQDPARRVVYITKAIRSIANPMPIAIRPSENDEPEIDSLILFAVPDSDAQGRKA